QIRHTHAVHHAYFDIIADYFSPFLFDFHAVLRALHSFPTRRSSDLVDELPRIVVGADGLIRVVVGENEDDVRALRIRAARGAGRSEEHTSELQSPYDLVCRLLLEKKKKARRPAMRAARSRVRLRR